MSLQKAIACIKKYNNFLITAHTSPEGDALGSELGFYNIVRALGKNAVIINEDSLPYGYDFLPGASNIKTLKKTLIKHLDFDCFVVLDCSDLRRTGDVYKLNTNHKLVLNIDHHISNEIFGDVNWVGADYSSCSEMIYVLHKKLGLEMTYNSALCLYVGILTDTGSFRYINTTSLTHKAAADLLSYGINVPQTYKSAYENIPFTDMKLLTSILPKMKRCADGKIVWFEMPHNLLKGRKLVFDLGDSLLSFARSIEGVEAAALFKENLGVRGEVRVNLRSTGKVDVNKIAKFFGGGGHKSASGITMRGKIASVRGKVLRKIKENL